MSVFWILIGLLAFCMPHLAAAGAGMAWTFAPYAGECSAVLLALSFAVTLDEERARELLPAATLAVTFVTLVFEAVCALVFVDEPASNALLLAEELLHALSMALWCAHAVLKGESASDEAPSRLTAPVLAVSVAGVLASAVSYAASQALMLQSQVLADLQLLPQAATIVWALPLVVLLWCLDSERVPYAVVVASPFVGALAANRIWWLTSSLSNGLALSIDIGVCLVLPVVFSSGALVCAWLMSGASQAFSLPGEEPTRLPEDALPVSNLPLNQLPGYYSLTNRERQTVEASVAGATTDEISQALGIAPGTVSTYRGRAYAKLGVKSTQELLSVAYGFLLHPRLFFEADDVPQNETDSGQAEQANQVEPNVRSRQTFIERFLPPVACVACAVLTVLVIFSARLLPVPLAPTLVVCLAGAVFVAVGRITSPAPRDANEQITALLFGAAVALAFASAELGPAPVLLLRATLAGVVLASTVWLTLGLRGMWPKLLAREALSCGLVLVTMAPASLLCQALLLEAYLPILAWFLLGAAAVIQALAIKRETSRVVPIVLTGDERVNAYLMGRGLNDLQSKVVLLTARGFAQGSIASSLCIARSTVSEYRTRAYRTLGVHNKDQLVELLSAEAGL